MKSQSNSDIRKIQIENLSKYGTMTINVHTCTITKIFYLQSMARTKTCDVLHWTINIGNHHMHYN